MRIILKAESYRKEYLEIIAFPLIYINTQSNDRLEFNETY